MTVSISSAQVHENKAMANTMFAYTQSANAFIAPKVFPLIKVKKQSDKYWKFGREHLKNSFRKRADGTESAGGKMAFELAGPYFCDVWAYHEDIGDQAGVNADDQIDLEMSIAETFASKANIAQEVSFVDKFMKTGVWAQDVQAGVGNVKKFNDDSCEIIKFVTDLKLEQKERTGLTPNTGVMSDKVLAAISNSPVVLDRIKFSGGVGPDTPAMATINLLKDLFGLNNIYVSSAVADLNETGDLANIMPDAFGLFYVNPNPTRFSVSAGLTFWWDSFNPAAVNGYRVKQFRLEQLEVTRYEAQMAYDQHLLAEDLGTFVYDLL